MNRENALKINGEEKVAFAEISFSETAQSIATFWRVFECDLIRDFTAMRLQPL